MARQFKSAANAAAALAGDPAAEALVERDLQDSRFISVLTRIRVEKGLTQKDIAQSMGCAPSKVSKMESRSDRDLKLSELAAYASALRVKATVVFDDPDLPAAQRIRRSVSQIHAQLELLARLAKEAKCEAGFADKIQRFYGEALFGLLMKLDSQEHQSPGPRRDRGKKDKTKPRARTSCG